MTGTNSEDTYRTLLAPSPEVLFRDRKSKFYGYAFPLSAESEVAPLVETLRKKHRNASHICYAWRLGTDAQTYRAHDDGEPTHSAGMPIYGQILSFNVTGVLLAVVRIYGGTKLGVGGLVSAYRTAARMAMEVADIGVQFQYAGYALTCPYEAMDEVFKILNRLGVSIVAQEIDTRCRLFVEVRKRDEAGFRARFKRIRDISLSPRAE
jgi:uncharacterized YigZ family protein